MREEEEFKWRLDEEIGNDEPVLFRAVGGCTKAEQFAKLWRWQLHLVAGEARQLARCSSILRRACGQRLQAYGKPFTVTTQMVRGGGNGPEGQGREYCEAFDTVGSHFSGASRANQESANFLCGARQGRGLNPFVNCG